MIYKGKAVEVTLHEPDIFEMIREFVKGFIKGALISLGIMATCFLAAFAYGSLFM